MSDERDHEFATVALNASLTLMSILVAVITFLAVEYRGVRADPPLADPLWKAVIGTTVASVFAGIISLAALVYLRSGRGKLAVLTWAFGILIAIMTGDRLPCAGTDGIAARFTMLQSDDWQMLKARKRFVTYLIEKTKAGHCGHLILYRRLAKIVLTMLQDTDRSANPFNSLRLGFAGDPSFHESMLAQLIKKTDLDLRRMIETEKMDFDSKAMDICKLYARLVIGHEDDLDCGTILNEIRVGLQQLQADVLVPSDETCR